MEAETLVSTVVIPRLDSNVYDFVSLLFSSNVIVLSLVSIVNLSLSSSIIPEYVIVPISKVFSVLT